MAETKAKAGSVTYRVNPNGSHSIGVEIGGVFVPFATQDGPYVEGLVQSGKETQAANKGNDDDGEGE